MGVRLASKASARDWGASRQKKGRKLPEERRTMVEKCGPGKSTGVGWETSDACSSDRDYSPTKAEVPDEDGR